MELRLYIDPDAPLAFIETTVAPADAPNAYRWLLDVGDLVLLARTGQYKGPFSNQSANVAITLDNEGRQASELVRSPLGVRATILNDDDSVYFSGLVQGLAYGTRLQLDIGA
jgi:hypothetical protein